MILIDDSKSTCSAALTLDLRGIAKQDKKDMEVTLELNEEIHSYLPHTSESIYSTIFIIQLSNRTERSRRKQLIATAAYRYCIFVL